MNAFQNYLFLFKKNSLAKFKMKFLLIGILFCKMVT